VRNAILSLQEDAETVKANFAVELTRLVYEGGGKDQTTPKCCGSRTCSCSPTTSWTSASNWRARSRKSRSPSTTRCRRWTP
jgi:hypothetical protein